MIILSFLVCLASAPADCREVELYVDGRRCSGLEQAIIADWIGKQPERWRLQGGWTCSTGMRA